LGTRVNMLAPILITRHTPVLLQTELPTYHILRHGLKQFVMTLREAIDTVIVFLHTEDRTKIVGLASITRIESESIRRLWFMGSRCGCSGFNAWYIGCGIGMKRMCHYEH
jgi:hypothetical protein